MSLTPFSKKKYSKHKFKDLNDYSSFTSEASFLFCNAELKKIINTFPIVFFKEKDNSFSVRALSGLKPDKNEFIDQNGKWVNNYIPAFFRSMPFMFLEEKSHSEPILFFEDQYQCVLPEDKCDDSFESIFKADGQFSEKFHEKLNFSFAFWKNFQETKKIVKSLENAGMIVEAPIKLKFDNNENEVKGLYKIDPEKLSKINEQETKLPFDLKTLALANAQFYSMENMQRVANMQLFNEKELKSVKQVLAPSQEKPLDIENVINSEDKNGKTKLSLRDKVLEKQKKESKEELDELVKNLISDE